MIGLVKIVYICNLSAAEVAREVTGKGNVYFSNGVLFSNGSLAWTILYKNIIFHLYMKWSRLSWLFFSIRKLGSQKRPVFKCFRFSNGRFSDPHCTPNLQKIYVNDAKDLP